VRQVRGELLRPTYLHFADHASKTPLDYANPNGPQAAIALLKIPSKYKPGEEGYKGPVLFNPGTCK
jgi:hypothetical protein